MSKMNIKTGDTVVLLTGDDQYKGKTGKVLEVSPKEQKVIVEGGADGVAKLMDRSAFAGSIATTDVLVRTCVKKAGIPLVSAVNMITRNPARIMKLADRGELREGLRADILVFDEENPEDFSCIYIDVNELHIRNNKYGHAAGDEMLIFIANSLKEVW